MSSGCFKLMLTIKTNVMKTFSVILLLLGFLTYSSAQNITSNTTWTGSFTLSQTLTVKSGATLTVTGSLADANGSKQLLVEAGATLIVQGNLTLTNTNSTLSGNVIVLGNVSLKNTDMIGAANLVVGGTLSSGGGNLNGVVGDVYLLDPTLNPNPPTLPNPPKTVDQLLVDEAGTSLITNITNIGSAATCTWTGGTSTAWTTTANWTNSKVPTVLSSIVIGTGTNAPVISGTLTIRDLTINSGATLTVAAGAKLTILGNVVNNGSLVVNNTNTSPASLLQYGTVTGNVTFNWTYTNLRYWYVGHSISNADMASYNAILGGADNNNFVINSYNGAWTRKTSGAFTNPMEGYALYIKNDATTFTHTGTLNPIDVDMQKDLISGWQLIANPYASYYQLPVEYPSVDFANTTGSVYVPTGADAASRTFATYNTFSGIGTPSTFDGKIAPGQSFWVLRNQVGKIYMRASNRVHDKSANASLKSASLKSAETNVLRMKLSNGVATDEAVLALKEGGVYEFGRYDSEKRFESGNKLSYIYSVKENRNTVINVLPTDVSDYTVKLGVRTQAGENVLAITGLQTIDEDLDVFLEDSYTGQRVDVRKQSSYTFTSEEMTNDDRFVLKMSRVAQVPVVEPQTQIAEALSDVLISAYGGKLIVKANNLELKDGLVVKMYSASGEQVIVDTFMGNMKEYTLPNTTGFYVVKVSGVDVSGKRIDKRIMIAVKGI